MAITAQPEVLIQKQRISSIDIVRGIVMVIMALDHTRDFFHADANLFDPTDMTRTTPVLFFTRWITHYCAPTFVFLSGVSVYISQQRKSRKELSLFLLTRGLWLVVLELTVIRLGIFFNLYYDVLLFQVIWVIGISMVVLAALIHLPLRIILATGIVILVLHNLLDLIKLTQGDPFFLPFSFLHQSGLVQVIPGRYLLIFYPFLPWLGIMILGYCLGTWYVSVFDAARRQKLLLRTGLLATVLFIVLRFINVYGDPLQWATQKNAVYTLLSFLNTTKYPPSLLYTLMTLGPVLILLSSLEKVRPAILNPFIVYGRVPLFYYVFHFYLIHLASVVSYILITGTSLSDMNFHFPVTLGGIPNGYGYSLAIVYVVWILVVVSLYPLCSRYNRYKSTHRDWWLSYL